MYTCKVLKVNLLNLLQIYRCIRTSQGFPCGSAGKESTCSEGNLSLILGLGRCPGEGKGYPLHFSGLENYKDCVVHGVTKSRTQLNDFHSLHYDFPGGPMMKILPSNAGGTGSVLSGRAKIPHASESKNQNMKQKQYCNKFNKDCKK